MDPNETLVRFLDALASQDRDVMVEAARDLADWLEKGGFKPDPRNPRVLSALGNVLHVGTSPSGMLSAGQMMDDILDDLHAGRGLGP